MRVVPLTPARWPALERLFGPSGACWGCWCMYWRLPRGEFGAAVTAKKTKAMLKRRVLRGPPPGVIAIVGQEAVGWLQIGPRADTPQWNGARRLSAPLNPGDAEDPDVWSASCFFVHGKSRGQGVTAALLDGAIGYARKNGARVIEACPVEGGVSAVSAFVGPARIFADAGFREVARRKANRPLMRLDLRPAVKRARRSPRA